MISSARTLRTDDETFFLSSLDRLLRSCNKWHVEGTPAAIVNVGSKQGITTPPGNTAYNVSKAGVKILTEGLQHELRSMPDCKLSAFLLIPGESQPRRPMAIAGELYTRAQGLTM